MTLARERPRALLTAVELEPAALEVARANARRHGVALKLVRGEWFDALAGERYDLIVSNPPYVAHGDPHLQRGDLRFEPPRALVGGADGLDCIRAIAAQAPAHLDPGAWLLLEHGHDQAAACRALLAAHGFVEVQSWRDLAGIERVSGARAAMKLNDSTDERTISR